MAQTDMAVRVIGGGAAIIAGSAGLAQAQDVGGFYAGLGISGNAGDFIAFGNDEYSIDGGPEGSLFAGYNFVSGDMIYGLEFSALTGAEAGGSESLYTGSIPTLYDLKGRVGTMVGQTMLYGSLGYSFGEVVERYSGEGDGDVSGLSIGAGFETSLTGNMFLGGDVTHRDLDVGGTLFGDPAEDYMGDHKLTTVSIRIGFRF